MLRILFDIFWMILVAYKMSVQRRAVSIPLSSVFLEFEIKSADSL